MSDRELIDWLRAMAGHPAPSSRHALVADRLEELAAAYDRERARADECEAWLARFATDNGAYRAGEAAGVAKALAVMRRLLGEEDALLARSPLRPRLYVQSLVEVIRAVEERCGPAFLPPHERSLARLRRLEEAMAEVVRRCHAQGVETTYDGIAKFAREALQEGG